MPLFSLQNSHEQPGGQTKASVVTVAWPSLYQGAKFKAEYFAGSCGVTKIDTWKFLIRKCEVKN